MMETSKHTSKQTNKTLGVAHYYGPGETKEASFCAWKLCAQFAYFRMQGKKETMQEKNNP